MWAPFILILRDTNTWQLSINILTTIVTFLMVALLQNSQTRGEHALQHKLSAIAEMLAHLASNQGLEDDAMEMRESVGLEERESSSNNANEP